MGGLLAGLPQPMSLEEYDRLCTMDFATTSHGPPKSGWEFDDIEKTIKKVAETPKESLFNKHGKPKFPTTSEIPEMVKSLDGRKPTAMAVVRTLRKIKLKKWGTRNRFLVIFKAYGSGKEPIVNDVNGIVFKVGNKAADERRKMNVVVGKVEEKVHVIKKKKIKMQK